MPGSATPWRGFASQIEREHAEELASAKRDLTDEARGA